MKEVHLNTLQKAPDKVPYSFDEGKKKSGEDSVEDSEQCCIVLPVNNFKFLFFKLNNALKSSLIQYLCFCCYFYSSSFSLDCQNRQIHIQQPFFSTLKF